MEESFNLVAKSRVNYYTPGSPVQVVRVELLQGSISKENAVCLSFKNLSDSPLTGLKVHFKCKGKDGSPLYESDFTYDSLQVENGEIFGMDDAVFVTPDPVSSIDVSLLRAWYGRKTEDLTGYDRVRLPAPKKLPPNVAEALQQQSGRKGMKYAPQVLENGWYCACGAFHANEENTVYCSECGSDRILLQNAIAGIIHPEAPAEAERPVGEEPTQIMDRAPRAAASEEEGKTRVMNAPKPAQPRPYPGAQPIPVEEDATAPVSVPTAVPEDDAAGDALAEQLIRWVPIGTAVLCAAIALGGFLYCQFLL